MAQDLKPIEQISALLTRSVSSKYNSRKVGDLKFAIERDYAIARLKADDYLLRAAKNDPDAFVNALLDLSTMGLSLSPSLRLAYLVPRAPAQGKQAIVHGIPSYLGFEAMALRSGVVTLIQSELVYSKDNFKQWADSKGKHILHEIARVVDRGEFEGAYTIARYANGEHHIEYMTAEDIGKCQEMAEKFGNAPAWKNWRDEQRKKCCARRAAKHWPKDREMERALELMDRAEPMDFSQDRDQTAKEPEVCIGMDEAEQLKKALDRVPEAQRDTWLKKMAEALDFASIFDVPMSRFEEVKKRLLDRMERTTKAKEPTA